MTDRVTYSIRSVDRLLKILGSYSLDRPERHYSDIAEETDIPSSTVFKLMTILRQYNFLEETEVSGSFRIGLKAYEIGNLYLFDRPLVELSEPHLKELVESLGLTANLAIRYHDAAVRILSELGTSPLSLTTRIGEYMPLYASGLGKALILDMKRTTLAELLPRPPWEKLTPNTIVDLEQLCEDLHRSKDRGYTLDDEEGTVGIRCVGYPIRDTKGEIIGAISVTGTTIEVSEESLPRIVQIVQTTGHSMSKELGFTSE